MIRKFFRFLRRLVLIVLIGIIFAGIFFMGYNKYCRHVPVEREGSCLIYDLYGGERETSLVFGQIQSNDFKEGQAVILTNFGLGFFLPVEMTYEALRSKGYIRVSCDEFKE